MIRSAKMKAITPPKVMPPRHRTAARGTLPTEQTKLTTATSGPISAPHTSERKPWPWRNRLDHAELGTHDPSAPAMRNPRTRSIHRLKMFMKK